jgi:hypothetical protein
MRVYKTRWFARFAKRERISGRQLADTIARAERGQIDADLGGGLIKQRVARPGQGRSGGWRTLIAYRNRQRAIFMFGFAKSDLDNIDDARLSELKAAARDLLVLTSSQIEASLADATLVQVPYGEKD